MDEKLKKYFLGTLSPAEIEEIELRLISEAAFEDELILAKENLMEDYLDEMLLPDEAENFRTNFLSSPERLNELKTLAALKNYAREKTAEKNKREQTESSPGGFFEKVNKFFALNIRPIAAAAVILIAIFAGYKFLIFEKNELAALNDKNFENVEEYKNFTNLNLISGTLRSSDRIPVIDSDKLTDPVFLRLALALPGDFFDVRIFANDKNIVSDLRARAYLNQSGRELRLLLPASVLTPGNYRIEVFPAETPNMPATYSFTVK